MATLNQLIHALPLEFFGHIQHLVFTSNENQILVQDRHTPSHLLHVSSTTREKYASRFYGGSTQFVFTHLKPMLAFLSNLSEAHRGLVQKVGFRVDVSTTPVTADDCKTYSTYLRLLGPSFTTLPELLEPMESVLKGMVQEVLADRKVTLEDGATECVYDMPSDYVDQLVVRQHAGLLLWYRKLCDPWERVQRLVQHP